MSPESQRKLTSGAGVAGARTGLPATGTRAGAWRGAGFGQPFGATERTDRWWLIPVTQAIGLVMTSGYLRLNGERELERQRRDGLDEQLAYRGIDPCSRGRSGTAGHRKAECDPRTRSS